MATGAGGSGVGIPVVGRGPIGGAGAAVAIPSERGGLHTDGGQGQREAGGEAESAGLKGGVNHGEGGNGAEG